MGKFVLSNQAQADIDEISDYLAERSVKSALAVGAAIYKTCSMIGDMPDIGHTVDSIGSELRQVIVGKYRTYVVFYVVTHGVPLIVRVLHAKRDIPTLLHEWYGGDEQSYSS